MRGREPKMSKIHLHESLPAGERRGREKERERERKRKKENNGAFMAR